MIRHKHQSVSWEAGELLFRPAEPEDIPAIMAMECDPENNRFVVADPEEEHRWHIDEDQFYLWVGDGEIPDHPVAFILGVNHNDYTFELRRFVIRDKGRGLGEKALRALFYQVFEVLQFHRLWLDVYEDNLPAIRLYEKVGMVREGMLRESHRELTGEYRNQILYSMLDREYEENK